MKKNIIEFLARSIFRFAEAALAIFASLFLFFGISVITQGMKNISVSFQVLSWQKTTGPDDYILNSAFFFAIATVFLLGLFLVWFVKKLVNQDLNP